MIPLQPTGSKQFHGRGREEQATYARLAPFVDRVACRCGSRNRVFNHARQVFCQRCGQPAKTPTVKRLFGVRL